MRRSLTALCRLPGVRAGGSPPSWRENSLLVSLVFGSNPAEMRLMGLDGPQPLVEDGPEPLVGQHSLRLDVES